MGGGASALDEQALGCRRRFPRLGRSPRPRRRVRGLHSMQVHRVLGPVPDRERLGGERVGEREEIFLFLF